MNGNLVGYSGGDSPGDTGQPIELYLRGLVDSTSASRRILPQMPWKFRRGHQIRRWSNPRYYFIH